MLSRSDCKRIVLQFEAFELDPEAGKLKKSGAAVRLSPQAFNVLIELADSSGQVLSRDELQQKIWGNSFVDFEHGLNRCIKQIRTALCDSADNPSFIETLRGRGYQFLKPIRRVHAPTAQGCTTNRKSLAVLPFRNLSGRTSEDWISLALSEMITTELVMSDKLLAFTPDNQKADERQGAEYLLHGTYVVLPGDTQEQIRVDVRLQTTSSGDVLIAFSESNFLQNLPALISTAGQRLRSLLLS